MTNAFVIVKMFEDALAEYCGAPYAIAVNSGTSAFRLAFTRWGMENVNKTTIHLPAKTYRSVDNMAEQLKFDIIYDKKTWSGVYPIKPTNIWDCALRLAPNMYHKGTVQCLSFHPQKPLALSSGGGAILHDDKEADEFYRLFRYDSRTGGVPIKKDKWQYAADHCYMFPGQAGEALHKLNIYADRYPEHAPDMPQPDYEDLESKQGERELASIKWMFAHPGH